MAVPAVSGSLCRAAGEHRVCRPERLRVSLHVPLCWRPGLSQVCTAHPMAWERPGEQLSAQVRQACYQCSRLFKDKVLEVAAKRCRWPAQLLA